MFSLAVSIPYNSTTKKYDMSKVTDTGDQVRERIASDCEVYTSTRVVAATVLRWPNVLDQCPDKPVQWPDVLTRCGQTSMTWAEVAYYMKRRETKKHCKDAVYEGRADHAEYRILQRFDTLVNNHDENDLLLFYVLASPCDQRCTSESGDWSILDSIKKIKKWENYAVVFSNVFKPRQGKPIPEEELRGALERLGKSIGLSNIFRCNGEDEVQCTSCSRNNEVASYCISDDSQPGSSHNLPSTSFIQPQHDRSDSPSQSGQGDRGQQNNNINTSAGVSTNVDSNTGGGQGGSDSGGGKGRRRRGRGKKGKHNNEGDGVSSSQSGLEVRNTDVDRNTGGGQGGSNRGSQKRQNVRKVGGRRVGKKRRGGGNKQKSQQAQSKKKKQTNKRKKTQSKGTTQWSQKVQGKAKTQSEKRQKSKQPQNRGKKQRGGKMKRINQPQRRGRQRKGGKQKKL